MYSYILALHPFGRFKDNSGIKKIMLLGPLKEQYLVKGNVVHFALLHYLLITNSNFDCCNISCGSGEYGRGHKVLSFDIRGILECNLKAL